MLELVWKDPARLAAIASRVATWYAKRATDGYPRPLSAGMYLTNRCNLRCEMCNIWRHPDRSFLSMDTYQRIVTGLGRVGTFYLSFAGGEPTLDPRLGERIRFAKEQGIPYVHTVSNGMALTERRCRELKDAGLDELSVSIDGLEADHDRIRGVSGSFRRTLAGLENWRRVAGNVPVVVNTVLLPGNLDSLMPLARMIRDLGHRHKFQPVNAHPEFSGMESQAHGYTWTPAATERIRAFLAEVKTWPTVVNSSYFLSHITEYIRGTPTGGLFDDDCEYPYHHLEVTSDGKLSPCLTGMDWENGFVLEGELEDLLKSPEYVAAARRLTRCDGCKKNMFICNFEPRVAFPFSNFVKYAMFPGLSHPELPPLEDAAPGH